ncbi:hypothetical protein P171DRAFT_433333 [Karstenula rhodostoma CBS 690.94]|uniref:Uncharacterized protein n=1 Tax=Karstenula rhodostoma CBS 690.94 TaxID=1392251 RepID=A0A9P4PGK8_9PLEO|nr:hypothetical protein P171DRAFT_433333 [Karstenula rhodostoma CBS 690.94]
MPETNKREGTWQKLVIARSQTATEISAVSFEQAVLVDFPLQTAVAALHLYLGMEKPGKGTNDENVLIWDAGGAVGSYAGQYAKTVSFKCSRRRS